MDEDQGASDGRKGFPNTGMGESLEEVLPVLRGGRDIGTDSGEPPGTFLGTERPGDFLIDSDESKFLSMPQI